MSLFVGITFLLTHMSLVPSEKESLLSLMTHEIAGDGLIYFWVQLFTALILLLAANTGFQDFPRLSSFLGRDRLHAALDAEPRRPIGVQFGHLDAHCPVDTDDRDLPRQRDQDAAALCAGRHAGVHPFSVHVQAVRPDRPVLEAR